MCFKAGRILNGKIRAVTVRVNSRKQYQASILVESENQTFKKTKKSVGIDLGLKSLAITSDGQKEDILKVDDGLNKQLRIWERKKSRRYENAKKDIAELNKGLAQRDFNGETYEFCVSPTSRDDFKEYYKIIQSGKEYMVNNLLSLRPKV